MTIAQRRGREGDPMAVQSVAGAQRGAAPFSIRTIALPLAAIVLGTFMAILDNTVVNVALPTLERFFKADLHQIQWVITGYMLAQAAVTLGLRALPNLGAQRAVGALDTLGALLAPLGFAAVSYGISESTTAGWTGTQTLAGLAVGAVALGAFAVRELTTAAPLLELRVFRGRDFSLAIVTQWVGQAALFGALFLVPLFLQQVRGYGAFDTGLFTLPQAIAAAVFMPIGGRLFDRIGARAPAFIGLVLITVSTWFLAQIT